MNILDKFLPVVQWDVTANGQSFGVFHARTAWGAKRFVTMHARKILPVDDVRDEYKRDELGVGVRGKYIEDYSLAKKFSDDITEGLHWNTEHADEYVPGAMAVIEVNYKKNSKGKTRDERHTFGVVIKLDTENFIKDLTEKWDAFVDGLSATGKPLPSISELEFLSWPVFIGWRRNGKQIDNYDVEDKYKRTDINKAFKQLKSL